MSTKFYGMKGWRRLCLCTVHHSVTILIRKVSNVWNTCGKEYGKCYILNSVKECWMECIIESAQCFTKIEMFETTGLEEFWKGFFCLFVCLFFTKFCERKACRMQYSVSIWFPNLVVFQNTCKEREDKGYILKSINKQYAECNTEVAMFESTCMEG